MMGSNGLERHAALGPLDAVLTYAPLARESAYACTS